MDMNERGFVSELRKQVLRQFIVARAGDRGHRAQGRGHGGSRLSGPDPVGGLFPPARFRGGRHSRAVRGCAQGLLQRSQVELSRARIPGDDHSGARAGHDRQSGRGERRRRRGRLSEARRKGSPVRRAREARSAADPVSQRGRRRRGRGQAQGRGELRRPRQGARPQARGHRHRRDDQGRHARQGRGQRRLRPAARGRQRRAEEPVRSGDRSRQKHHPLDGQALRRGRRRGEEAGLRLPRRRQDPGPARQDRGPAGVRQDHPRSRQGGGLDRADRSPRSTPRATTPKARRSTCRTRPNCCAPPSLPTSGWTRRR